MYLYVKCQFHLSEMAFVGNFLLNLIKILIKIWEILFGWIYAISSNPSQVRKGYARVRSNPTKPIKEGDTSVIYQPNDLGNPKFIQDFKVGGAAAPADLRVCYF